jgi:ATPases involved in chromosome partitioning
MNNLNNEEVFMSNSCDSNCSSCATDCGDRTTKSNLDLSPSHDLSKIKRVIGVVSGKGGVGKSLVTSMLAVEMNKRGYETAILDADITGPSIPKSFGITEKASSNELGMFPVRSHMGIKLMSINLLLQNDTDPVVWRGPMIGGAVKQFWTDVIWGDVDYMFVDMPPGTGDVALTVFQNLPIDGMIIVTTPQDLVSMIVTKAVKMASMLKIPVLGIVENMSYFKCPDCDKEHYIYGKSNADEVANNYGLNVMARLPIDPKHAAACDRGMIELADTSLLNEMVKTIETLDLSSESKDFPVV